MDIEPLLSIGAFARAVDLAPSALRYYDEVGLLSPAEVDAHTGYRYYTPDLERRAAVIRRLREIGAPVETMRLVLDGEPDEAATALLDITATADRTKAAVDDVLATLAHAANTVGPAEVTVSAPELATALHQVAHAADTREGGPLTGVLIDVASAELSVVATNRYWLAHWSIGASPERRGEARGLVPLAAVDDLAEWLVLRRTATVCLTADTLGIVADGDERTVDLADDRFPAWRLVVDGQPEPVGRVIVGRDDLVRSLDGTSVTLAVGDDRLTVRPVDGPEGIRLSARTVGERLRFDLSVHLLTAVTRALVGPRIVLDYAARDRAVAVGSPSQPRLTALLMPIA